MSELGKKHMDDLRSYIIAGHRGREPVFVGRKTLFDLVEDNIQSLRNGQIEGRTICLSGPPGIGKTAFLRELKNRYEDPFKSTLVVQTSSSSLHNPSELVADIIEQFSDNWLSSLKNKTHKEMLAHRIRRGQEAVIKLPMVDIPVDFSLNPSHADGFLSDVLRPLLTARGKTSHCCCLWTKPTNLEASLATTKTQIWY